MPFYTRVARPGFKWRATAVSKRNLIRSTEFDSAVARRLKRTEVTEQRRPHYRRLIMQRWRANLHGDIHEICLGKHPEMVSDKPTRVQLLP